MPQERLSKVEVPQLMIKESVVVCVSGMAGSGKSTMARRLAEKYGLKYCSGGDVLKNLALKEGYRSLERGWWESEQGLLFLKERIRNPEFDRAVDKKLLKIARQGNVVLDSWTMPWLLKKGFKIWLETSQEKRAKRTAKRDGISVEKAKKALEEKEEKTKAIYRELYGFSLGEDLTPFQCILDTDNLRSDEVFYVLCVVLDNVVLGGRQVKSRIVE